MSRAAGAFGTPATLWELVRYFLYLGSLGFGGPVALVGYMQRDLVEQRKWFSKEDYMKGLALSQLAPGPLAAQLAICLGYVHSRVWGATLVSLAFILPSYLMTVAISMLYVQYGGLTWMQAAFYGVGAGVIGIIVRAAYRLTRLTVGSARLLWSVFAVMAVVTAWTESEIATLFILCGVAVLFIEAPPRWLRSARASLWAVLPLPASLLSGIGPAASAGTLGQILWFFAKAGAFVFGSGLAIVPFLYGGVVQEYRWLNDKQFLDAVAVAMITPGPIVITVAFIGYLVGGQVGALMAAIGVFLPIYLFVVIPYPWFDRFSENPQVKAFVRGVTAAAAGAIAGACFVLARRAIIDPPTLLIALAALAILTRFKIPEPVVIIAAGILGIAIFSVRP
ncbi:MAG: chromate transporter [Candidatus Rokubacteria bacterium]|nr:chromate transporter [Candidatus Rokubacteria bacterium]